MASDGNDDAFLGVETSLTGRRWRARAADPRLALSLAQRLSVPEIVGRVLAARGVDTEDSEAYLAPTLRGALPDPSDFRDMDKAAERLARAVTAGEPIVVFGDYDVDGATSSALLERFLKAAGGQATIYIPDRLREGYGPNAPALKRLREEGAAVVVTVDCGTTAYEALAQGSASGLDVIVADHHLAEPHLPECFAVVNPNRLDERGDHGQLAAVGVSFLLAVAVNRLLRERGWYDAARPEPDLRRQLDLVALGTVCDLVPLTGVNRALVIQGLKVVAGRGNLGLAVLADVARIAGPAGTYHLGYILGPRINAGGRVGRADLGARLLTTEDEGEALAIARELEALNAVRREIEQAVEEAAVGQILRSGGEEAPVIFAADESWHPGVIGIVANRLVERFGRPAFVVALEGDTAKGSGRSIRGVDLGAAVTAARQAGLLINGGGHAMAAGITVESARLGELQAFLRGRVESQVDAATAGASLGLDGALAVSGATRELFETLERAGPYGSGNPEPRFAVAAAQIVRADVVGERHVRCILADGGGGRLKAIAFRKSESELGRALLSASGARLHVAGHLRADDWRGKSGVQLTIDDAARAT